MLKLRTSVGGLEGRRSTTNGFMWIYFGWSWSDWSSKTSSSFASLYSELLRSAKKLSFNFTIACFYPSKKFRWHKYFQSAFKHRANVIFRLFYKNYAQASNKIKLTLFVVQIRQSSDLMKIDKLHRKHLGVINNVEIFRSP